MSRIISYSSAINEAFFQIMERDEKVFQIGAGINTPWFVGQTMQGLLEKFSEKRMIDTPVSENGVAGVAIGAALTGLKPILTFPRMDFMHYAMDQLINQAAMLPYSLGNKIKIPLTVRGIINRGGEQGAQHSQSLHAVFSHIPGWKVVMPSNPYDAKGLLIAAVEDDNPVLYIDDRWLYSLKGEVPQDYYVCKIGEAKILKKGKDLTVVASSWTVKLALDVISQLSEFDIELIDLRTIKPLDEEKILESVKKTKKAIVLDGGWRMFGVSSEISALIAEKVFDSLKAPVKRIALPDSPAPAAKTLEKKYYPDEFTVINTIKEILKE